MPPITETSATLLAILFVVLYVAPFYLSPTLRSSAVSNRDYPPVIKARIRAVALTCLACTVITAYVLAVPGHASVQECLMVLGVYPVEVIDCAKCMLLLTVLFAAPLFEAGIVEGHWRFWGRWRSIRQALFDDWVGWRNLIVGPVSEELVFRSFPIALFLLAQANPARIVFVTPLIFGLAHLHHLHEFVVAHQRLGQSYISTVCTASVLIPGIIRSLVQFTYTSLFGFFEAFVFLRTGNVWSCILAHTFCNWCGLPRFWGRLGQEVGEETVGVAEGKKTDDQPTIPRDQTVAPTEREEGTLREMATPGEPGQSLGTVWTITYYTLLVMGSFGFYKLLWPLTASDRGLASFV